MSDTKETTRPMTAEEFWEEEAIPKVDPFTRPFKFAEIYADYRVAFYLKNKPTKTFAQRLNEAKDQQQPKPLDPFEGAPEWAEWRAADRDGGEHWYAQEPQQEDFLGIHDANGFYMRCPDRRLKYTDWRQSPAKRQQ